MKTLVTARLILEPLRADHAEDMFGWLCDPALYEHIDEAPPESMRRLRERYRRLESRRSPDGSQAWLNWAALLPGSGPIGYVQATLPTPGTAWIAFVFSRAQWGHGYATEATAHVICELAGKHGVVRFLATAESANRNSVRLLERLGFRCRAHDAAPAPEMATGERLFVRDATTGMR